MRRQRRRPREGETLNEAKWKPHTCSLRLGEGGVGRYARKAMKGKGAEGSYHYHGQNKVYGQWIHFRVWAPQAARLHAVQCQPLYIQVSLEDGVLSVPRQVAHALKLV
jgi:hypothetical protein